MTVGPGDFVKVTYNGRTVPVRDKEGVVIDEQRDESPFKLMWDSRPYLLSVGQETFVPFEAMQLAFGDPRSAENVASVRDAAGNVMFILDRATEVRRLRTLYDNQFGDESTILYAPEATVHDIDGDEIVTVLDDPTGESVTPVQTTAMDRDQLLAQLSRQQRMIEALAEAQGVELPEEEVSEEQPTNTDDPFAQLPEDK